MRTDYMTKLSVVVFVFLFLGTLLVVASPAWGSSRIVNISLKKDGDFTKVAIYADKPFEFSHSTEEAKGDRPYRVIIDCKEAIFDLPRHNYGKGLPSGSITGIRTSQFQAVPERIVRVVLDLKGPVVYRVAEAETESEASIAILTTEDPDFPMWVAVLEEKKDQKLSVQEKRAGVPSVKTTSRKGQTSQDHQAVRPVTGSPLSPKVGKKEQAEFARRERIYRRAISYADTGETWPVKPVLLSRAESDDENRGMEERISEVVQEPSLRQQIEFVPVVSSRQAQSSPEKAKAKRIDKISRDDTDASAKPIPKTTSRTGVGEKETSTTTLLSHKRDVSKSRSPRRTKITRYPAPLGPFPEGQAPEADAAARTPVITPKAEKGEIVSAETPSALQKGIGRILGPEPIAAKETEALGESSTLAPSPQEAGLSIDSQREMIHYRAEARRDPFQPWTDKQEMSFGVMPLPLFENLKLVGILKDEGGNRALLEDEVGFGYIMASGDKIKNGYVINVENERAFFHVEEYGGYQVMVLELNREY